MTALQLAPHPSPSPPQPPPSPHPNCSQPLTPTLPLPHPTTPPPHFNPPRPTPQRPYPHHPPTHTLSLTLPPRPRWYGLAMDDQPRTTLSSLPVTRTPPPPSDKLARSFELSISKRPSPSPNPSTLHLSIWRPGMYSRMNFKRKSLSRSTSTKLASVVPSGEGIIKKIRITLQYRESFGNLS